MHVRTKVIMPAQDELKITFLELGKVDRASLKAELEVAARDVVLTEPGVEQRYPYLYRINREL